jgi:hypothetical protein
MNPHSFENGVGDQSYRNHIPASAPVPDRDAIFTTRIKLSTNIRMRSKCFSLQKKTYYQDERCDLQSLQHFLGNLHSFLNSLDEIRLADIKFKRFQQVFNSSNYQRMCISRILVAYKGWINVAEAFLNAYGSTLAFLHI